jgi:signal transduction histidine kinase
MAWEIRPTALDDLGLPKAIAQYLEEWAERSDLRIDQEIRIGDHRLPPPIETTLFRVVQEAIANVVKHAGADRVAVILDTDGKEVRLIIEDNGRGFPVGQGDSAVPGTHHLGLLGIRERLALVKGTLEVESLPGQGTTLYVRVPVPLMAEA